jgi:predicted dehydrogenase
VCEETLVVTQESKKRVGIIGANWTLKVHGSAWNMLPGAEVVAVCTAHEETARGAAEMFGIPKAYWNVADMCADPDIDIVDVGSRPAFRFDMVKTALEADKHVYNALPFALNLASAREQANLAAHRQRIGVVDAQFRWVPAAMHMQSLVSEGFLGKPLGFAAQLLLPLRNHGNFLYPHSAYPEGGISPYKWLADPESGGSGWRNFGTHMMLLLMPMFGKVASACGTDTRGIDRWELPDGTGLDVGTSDLGCGVLRMENGMVGTLQTGWAVADGPGVRLEVWGTNGRLVYTDPTFGDGVSAQLYAATPEPFNYGQTTGRFLDIPEELYR